MSLDHWLKIENIPGIEGIDTRELTKKLRINGVMLGILKVCDFGEELNIEKLINKTKNIEDPNKRDLVAEVSIIDPIIYQNNGSRVVVIDMGCKFTILRNLLTRNYEVIRVPYDFKPDEILEYHPDAFFIGNGPGDPKMNIQTIKTTQYLLENDLPFMGICMGNQIFSLAMGANTFKLKYGHRSQNQPAFDVKTNKCYITSQNHGYTTDENSLEGTGLEIWFINANDQTIEGLTHEINAFSVQFYPENYPGPMDTEFLFDGLEKIIK